MSLDPRVPRYYIRISFLMTLFISVSMYTLTLTKLAKEGSNSFTALCLPGSWVTVYTMTNSPFFSLIGTKELV